jgi:hypothetical protein
MKFINKKNTTKELSEGMSNIVYHFTYFSRLYNILKENKFHASPNIGSTSDLNIINKTKQHNIPIYFYDNENYYFSGTKNKAVDPYQVLDLPDGG